MASACPPEPVRLTPPTGFCHDAVYFNPDSVAGLATQTWQTDVTSTLSVAPPSMRVSGSAGQRSTGVSGPTCTGIVSTTNGFATKAVTVYANPTAQSGVAGNDHTVSQYDVACFQFGSR